MKGLNRRKTNKAYGIVSALDNYYRWWMLGLMREPKTMEELMIYMSMTAQNIQYHMYQLMDVGLVHVNKKSLIFTYHTDSETFNNAKTAINKFTKDLNK
jgi:DNA-binding transcriptional ArsR family regulator